MARIVFNGTPRLIRELAKVDFERMRRRAEHIYICTRKEYASFQTGNDNGTHRRILKTQTLDGGSEFKIGAQVIGIEFQCVPIGEGFVFLHIHQKGGYLPVNIQFPVFVLFGCSLKVDHPITPGPASSLDFREPRPLHPIIRTYVRTKNNSHCMFRSSGASAAGKGSASMTEGPASQ